MLCCNNCIINPICQIGCEKLLEDLNKIILKDFTKYKNLSKRLTLVKQLIKKKLVLNLNHNIKIIVDINSSCSFFKKNKLHREDGPAIECTNGDKFWYINGKLKKRESKND